MDKETVLIDKKFLFQIMVWLDAELDWEELDNKEIVTEMVDKLKTILGVDYAHK